jgi:hypothetical protein
MRNLFGMRTSEGPRPSHSLGRRCWLQFHYGATYFSILLRQLFALNHLEWGNDRHIPAAA